MELLVLVIVLHWRKILVVLAIALVFGSVRDAFSQQIEGRTAVVDGDTIEIRSERIRFNGIDAPEGQQLCQNAKGRDYRCGQVAAEALANFLSKSRPTRCEFVERDQYDRFVGDCYQADGKSAAKSERLGMWAGSFQDQ